MSPRAPDVAIIGGGIIGLTCAWYLARAGLTVTVIDRDRAAGAGHAAIGGLAPYAIDDPGPLYDLARTSLAHYPAFAASLEEETGQPVGYAQSGRVIVALSDEEAQALLDRYAWQFEQHRPVYELDREEIVDMVPDVATGAVMGMHFPGDHCITTAALLTALESSLEKNPRLHFLRADAERLVIEAGRAAGVVTGTETVRAGWIVNASGAWSGRWGVPVRPVRGQSVAIRWKSLPCVVSSEQIALVPCLDGRLIVGSTFEEVGFDSRSTVEGVRALLDGLRRLLPKSEEATFESARAGLRPVTPDDLPVLGPAPDLPNLVHAAGHSRRGFLLAPVTGDLVTRIITGGDVPGPLDAFSVSRFESRVDS